MPRRSPAGRSKQRQIERRLRRCHHDGRASLRAAVDQHRGRRHRRADTPRIRRMIEVCSTMSDA
jgi:hypothetical protein